uniref:Matrix protein n=1 Tax=avian paramyxovirus 2 TaxID=2560313 RepID=A0A1Q2TSM2_9MONO|nr:matrix protein [Avian metaavulavirus 2]BAW94631.1 matrix protein [Avian metaavulavirus 2]
MAQTTVRLYIDEASPDIELLSYPLIMKDTGHGTKELQQQIRVAEIGALQGGKNESVFINAYGFVQQCKVKPGATQFFQVDAATKPEVVTAGMIIIGAVKGVADITKLAEEVFELDISIKKSASFHEKVAVSFNTVPLSLMNSTACRNLGYVTNAEEAIKCPSKIQAGVTYKFKIMFVSLTRLHNGKLYRVPKAVYAVEASALYKVQLEVGFKLDVAKDHPHVKMLKKVKRNGETLYLGYAWFHLCNFKKTNAKGESRTISNLEGKVRAMGIKVSLYDLWGPTLVVQITGKTSKYAQGFFSTTGTCCLPVSKAAPELAKLMWSCNATIVEAAVIIQGSDRRAVVTSEDLEVYGAVAKEKQAAKGFHPFRK